MRAQRKIVLAGGTGFLGELLTDWFIRLDWEVVVLSRQPMNGWRGARVVPWDGRTIGPWAAELDGADVIVNLAGRSVDCRYHARNRREILDSRLEPTRVLGRAIARCAAPPAVWLNASTATIYKHSLDEDRGEQGLIAGTPEAKDEFSVEVAQAWERALDEAHTPRTRKVALRTAMVFGTRPRTVYPVLRRLARLGLGGAMAGGRQYVSWLHQDDFCRAVAWLIERDDLQGPMNLAVPFPLTNRQLMQCVRGACRAPWGLPASRWMLEVGALLLRTESELVIKSRRVVPTRLLESGFAFRFPDLPSAVADLETRIARAPGSQRSAHTGLLASAGSLAVILDARQQETAGRHDTKQ